MDEPIVVLRSVLLTSEDGLLILDCQGDSRSDLVTGLCKTLRGRRPVELGGWLMPVADAHTVDTGPGRCSVVVTVGFSTDMGL